jgi:hypothetical protein
MDEEKKRKVKEYIAKQLMEGNCRIIRRSDIVGKMTHMYDQTHGSEINIEEIERGVF